MDEFTRYCLKRELRSFRRGRGLLVLVVGGLHFIGYMIARLGFEFVDEDIAPALYFYFTGFHLWLFVAVPLIVWWQARQFRVYRLDELRMTLIPERTVLLTAWLGAVIKPLVFLLPLYLSLLWTYRWLINFEPFSPFWNHDPTQIHWLISYIISHLGIIALLLFPLFRPRRLRKIVLAVILGFIVLGAVGTILTGDGSLGIHALFYPTVTLSYFLMTIGLNSLLAIRVGLSPRNTYAGSKSIPGVFIPLAAEAIMIIVYVLLIEGDLEKLFGGWTFLFYMLIFYIGMEGAVWMALKWNLIWWMLRRPLKR